MGECPYEKLKEKYIFKKTATNNDLALFIVTLEYCDGRVGGISNAGICYLLFYSMPVVSL
jgi:hypothetical protein